jgi:formylmethanofuran dehydrogenase subunit E
MRRIELSNQDDIIAYQQLKKAQISDAFNKSTTNENEARVITKAEMETEFPPAQYEYYPLAAVHKFRQELMKAEGVEDKDGAFRDATAGLQSFVVQNEGKKTIVFVRKKETEE